MIKSSNNSSSKKQQQLRSYKKGVDPSEPLLPKAVRYMKQLQLDDDNNNVDDEEHVHHHHHDYYLGLNRNVAVTLAFTGLSSAGRSLWSQNVLSTYVFLLTHGNAKAVGMITSIMGMIQLLASFPTGFLADQYRRDSILKLAAVVGMAAALITTASLLRQGHDDSENWLRLALAVWGIFWGITNTALSALFADSIPKGSRPHYFTHRAVLLNLGNLVGPIVAILLFSQLGNKWSLKDCAIVMAVGQLVCIASLMLLCFLNDDDAAAVEDDGDDDKFDNDTDEVSTAETAAHDESDDDSDSEGASCFQHNHHKLQQQQQQQHSSVMDDITASACYKSFGFFSKHRAVPVLVAMSDVAGGLAAGMSIRYFPIFFAQNLDLSPVAVQCLYIIAPLFQSMLMKLAYRCSQRYGRCRVSVVHKWTGIVLMLLMVWCYQQQCHVGIVCALYILRTAFMNSTSALTKSVLMDSVPRRERAKWSALESVNMFSWSGSAAIGGLLVAYKGVLFNFCITAGIQFLASLPLVVLCWDEDDVGEEHGDTTTATTVVKLLDPEDSMSMACDDNHDRRDNGHINDDDDDDDDELSMVESAGYYPSYTEVPCRPSKATTTTSQCTII